LRKWVKRHRPLVAAACLFLICVALVAGGFLLRLEQRRAAAEDAATVYLHRAELLREQGNWPEARAALARAEERLSEDGPEPLRRHVKRLQDELDWVMELDAACLHAAEANAGVGVNFTAVDGAYRKAFAKRHLDVEGGDADAAAQRIRALGIRDALVQALDHWAYMKEHLRRGGGEPLLRVARRIDDDPWRQRLRDPRVWSDRAALEKLAGEPAAPRQPTINLVILCLRLDTQGAPATAERLLRRAQADRPQDFWLNMVLANFLSSVQAATPSRLEEAVGFYRAALVQRPRNATVHLNFGAALGLLGRHAEAEQAFRKVLELRGPHAPTYSNLAVVLLEQQRLTEAEQACRRALALQPDFADARNNLGNVLMRQGKLIDAEDELRRAIELSPGNAEAHHTLGGLLGRQRRLAEAEAEFRAVIALRPNNAAAHADLGLACHQQGKFEEAEQAERRAVALQPGYAEAWFNLSNVLKARDRLDEAEDALRRALACKPDFAAAQHNLRLLLEQRGRSTSKS
jgi:Flp pilus assembly protein TadD